MYHKIKVSSQSQVFHAIFKNFPIVAYYVRAIYQYCFMTVNCELSLAWEYLSL